MNSSQKELSSRSCAITRHALKTIQNACDFSPTYDSNVKLPLHCAIRVSKGSRCPHFKYSRLYNITQTLTINENKMKSWELLKEMADPFRVC